MPQLERREFLVRKVDAETRTFTGLAVPFDTDTRIGSYYTERVAKGAVRDSDGALLLWRHDEPIGKLIANRDTKAGWEIDARISETARGDEAYTLLRDGVVDRLSIGFEPIEHEEHRDPETDHLTITRTNIRVREVSLVPFPAYPDAAVSDVRAADPTPTASVSVREAVNKEGVPSMDEDTITAADLTEVRESIEDLARRLDTFTPVPPTPSRDERSAGEYVKALAAGDAETVRAYEAMVQQERAYTGSTTADLGTTLKPGWVGDLTRIFDASTGVLADTFSTGKLPDSGMSIEYAELGTNTLSVTEQAAEGDDITFGKVTLTTKSAPVKTYAGGTQLTRQEIERATIGVLNTSLEALAMAAGVRKKIVLRTEYNTLVAARKAIAANAGVVVLGATLGASTAGNWEDALIDAAIKYEALNLPLEALLVSGSVFKKLRSLTVSGERVMQVAKDNSSGTLNLRGLTGDLAGLPVKLDTGQAGDEAVFTNSRALRQYETGLVHLSDENIVNLSKAFAVYKYGAVAAEIPSAIIPVKLAAS